MPLCGRSAFLPGLLLYSGVLSAQTLPVFIRLKDQPHRRILAAASRQAARQTIEAAIKPGQDAIETRLKALGGSRIQRYTILNLLRADIPVAALDRLRAHPAVARVFPVLILESQLVNSIPAMGATAFWTAGYTGGNQSVAVLDSGLNPSHPAFTGLTVNNQVFLSNGAGDPCFSPQDSASSPLDRHGHGTAVSGVIASQGAPGWTNYLGVAHSLGTLYNLKVAYLNRCNPGTARSNSADVLAAIDWAVLNTPVSVFNYSYGGTTNSDDDGFAQQMDDIVDTWGVSITISAGNSGSPNGGNPHPVTTPGIAWNVVTAANWDTGGLPNNSNETINLSSSRGPTAGGRFKPDLSAPGTLIYLPQYNTSDFSPWTGTSFAAPHTAGALALLHQAGVTAPIAAKAILLNTADGAEWQIDGGWGYANLTRALQELPNGYTASIGSNQFLLYRGSTSGPVQSTLVWNRHIDSQAGPLFSDLNLYLYDGVSGAELASSASSIQNVERVAGSASEAVLKVSAPQINLPAGTTSEPLALAISQPGFVSASGPALTESCAAPGTVNRGVTFTVSCTVFNAGDLAAFSVQGPLNFSGQTGGQVNSFGTVTPGSSSTRDWSVTASSTPGTYTLAASIGSSSFGESFAAGTTVNFDVGQACSYAASPSSATALAGGFNSSITINSGTGCSWVVASDKNWITFPSGASGSGAGTVDYFVSPSNLPVPRSGSLALNGQTATAITQASSNQAFVTQQYSDLLGRNPDSSGLSYWTNILDSGGMTQSQMAANFFTSREFAGNGSFVFGCYLGILGRDADFGGWNYWFSSLQQGQLTGPAVLNSFLASPEYQQRFGAPDDSGFVTELYHNTLDREPDSGGLSYWVGQLRSGAMTRAQVVNSFITSPEFISINQDRVYAFMLYFGFLRRDPDASGLSYWLGQIQSGWPLSNAIGSFITSPEYVARF